MGSPSPTPMIDTNPESPDPIKVFFTDPADPNADTYRGGPDAELARAIDQAHLSVDVAIMHVNLWSIRDALIDAHRRGITVRVVVESDNLDELEVEDIREAGIPILGDRREALMHHKFVVIDDREVWTGSMNFTVNGGYKNNNNLVRIRSTRIAENYKTEFDEMFEDDLFGNQSRPNTPHPSVTIDGTLIESYFAPEDDTGDRIVQLIGEAEESIHFMAFSFTSDSIGAAMIEQAYRGISVSGVFEESQYYSNIGTEYDNLLSSGVDVRLDGNRFNMHHKVIIIDRDTVIMGSYNFSKSAETHNDENTLIIHSIQIADLFMEEFEQVYTAASNP